MILPTLFLILLLSITESHSKRFKPHGRYESLARQEYSAGLRTLVPNAPDGVLTSLTGIDGMIAVTWFTLEQSVNATVQHSLQQANSSLYWGYESGHYEYEAHAQSNRWIDPSSSYNHRSLNDSVIRTLHQAMMTQLKPGAQVYYRVGSIDPSLRDLYGLVREGEIGQKGKTRVKKSMKNAGLSDELIFQMPPIDQTINLIVYGDMGVVNAQSMQAIQQEITPTAADQPAMSHMILHLGDYAYDLHTDNGTLGDVFMHNLTPISSRVPYMGCEGNHEGKYNASHYTNRFWAYNMLGRTSRSDTNWWFSWEYVSGGARVHFVAINTEMYYTYVDEFAPPDYHDQRMRQYEWLKQDLTKATTGKNKADWVFVYGHRPMYCSDVDSLGDCTSDATLLREGWPGENNGMDALLAKFGVDIYFTAHEHSYERTYPVSFGKIDLAQQNHTHINPLYPVHIITGSAGCSEELEWFDPVNFAAWSMVRSPTYGYGHLIIHNSTHLYWDQLIDEGRQGRDYLWIIKDPKVKRFDEQDITFASE